MEENSIALIFERHRIVELVNLHRNSVGEKKKRTDLGQPTFNSGFDVKA